MIFKSIPDLVDLYLDPQCIFINSSSTSYDLMHLLHQIHASRSLMLTNQSLG